MKNTFNVATMQHCLTSTLQPTQAEGTCSLIARLLHSYREETNLEDAASNKTKRSAIAHAVPDLQKYIRYQAFSSYATF